VEQQRSKRSACRTRKRACHFRVAALVLERDLSESKKRRLGLVNWLGSRSSAWFQERSLVRREGLVSRRNLERVFESRGGAWI